MISALQTADYFLAKADEDAGDLISNLKLQKLLYYGQGFTLAMTGKPLFPEKIEAWTHGPVVPAVYRKFKENGNSGIPSPQEIPLIEEPFAGILDEVYNVYGQFSAWKLRNMTHEEAPWKDTPVTQEISHNALAEFFKTQLV